MCKKNFDNMVMSFDDIEQDASRFVALKRKHVELIQSDNDDSMKILKHSDSGGDMAHWNRSSIIINGRNEPIKNCTQKRILNQTMNSTDILENIDKRFKPTMLMAKRTYTRIKSNNKI